MNRSVFPVLLLTTLLLLAASASATSGELMSFNGLGNLQPAGSFYNGGGTLKTPNYGVTFSSDFYGLSPSMGSFTPTFTLGGQTVNIPSALFICPGLTCTAGTPAVGVMNVGPGFSNGLNFYFTAGFTGGQTETVTIWSGANGTGTVLATLTLANNNGNCTSPSYCNWSNIGIAFSGTAHSVTFSGPADQLGLAYITLNSSTTAIPEPSSIFLLSGGLVAVSLKKIRQLLRT